MAGKPARAGADVDRLDRQARRSGCRVVTQEALDAHARTARRAEELEADVARLERQVEGLQGRLVGEQRRAAKLLDACNRYRRLLDRRSPLRRLTSRLRYRSS